MTLHVGSLVRHKRTHAVGLVMSIPYPKPSLEEWLTVDAYDIYYDVEWYDGFTRGLTSHRLEELDEVEDRSESR